MIIIIFKVAVYASEESTVTKEEPLGRARRNNTCFSHGAGKVPVATRQTAEPSGSHEESCFRGGT